MKNIKSKKTKLAPIKEKPNLLEDAMKKSNDEILAKAIQDMLKKDTPK